MGSFKGKKLINKIISKSFSLRKIIYRVQIIDECNTIYIAKKLLKFKRNFITLSNKISKKWQNKINIAFAMFQEKIKIFENRKHIPNRNKSYNNFGRLRRLKQRKFKIKIIKNKIKQRQPEKLTNHQIFNHHDNYNFTLNNLEHNKNIDFDLKIDMQYYDIVNLIMSRKKYTRSIVKKNEFNYCFSKNNELYKKYQYLNTLFNLEANNLCSYSKNNYLNKENNIKVDYANHIIYGISTYLMHICKNLETIDFNKEKKHLMLYFCQLQTCKIPNLLMTLKVNYLKSIGNKFGKINSLSSMQCFLRCGVV